LAGSAKPECASVARWTLLRRFREFDAERMADRLAMKYAEDEPHVSAGAATSKGAFRLR
jgi:hypothetical protein